MKNSFLTTLIFLPRHSSCGQNKAREEQQAVHDTMATYRGEEYKAEHTTRPAKAPAPKHTPGNLIGEWKCSLVASDFQNNGILNTEEKASGYNTHNASLKLIPDGTGVYSVAQPNCANDTVEKEKYQAIEVIEKVGSQIKYGRIISQKADELQQMKVSEGRSFPVYIHR